jgi:hypothetical protein
VQTLIVKFNQNPSSSSKTKQWTNRFFFIWIVVGGVQLSPLGTAATNRPIVSAPGDYDDGEIGGMIGRGNRSTRRKPTQCRFVHHKPHMLPGREPESPRWEIQRLTARATARPGRTVARIT